MSRENSGEWPLCYIRRATGSIGSRPSLLCSFSYLQNAIFKFISNFDWQTSEHNVAVLRTRKMPDKRAELLCQVLDKAPHSITPTNAVYTTRQFEAKWFLMFLSVPSLSEPAAA